MAFCTFYHAAVPAAPDNNVVAGVFIPYTNIQGFGPSEFAANQSQNLKECKAVYGLTNSMVTKLALVPSPLGIAIKKSNPAGTGLNRFKETVTMTFEWLNNFANRSVTPVPLNATNYGLVSIANIFPNSTLVEDGDEIPQIGLLFPNSIANQYGAASPTNVNNDARDWIYALFLAMVANISIRSSSIQSAITSVTNLLTTRLTGITMPASYYGVSPDTGIEGEDLAPFRLLSESLLIEYEVQTTSSTYMEVRFAYA